MTTRRAALRGALGLGAAAAFSDGRASAQEARFFTIGTGGPAGTYFPIGGLIADVISNPPGSRACAAGGDCGVPGLIARAQSSGGSVDNLTMIADGVIDSGFAQSDIAYGAAIGDGVFAGRPPLRSLRMLASLYPETLQLVTRPDLGVASVADLRGLRVSLDDEGSGTIVDARLVLRAFGLSEEDIVPVYAKPSRSIGMMFAGELDAFFIVAGYPTASVVEVVRDLGAYLVPIAGPEIDALLETHPFFSPDLVPFGTYPNHPHVKSISVVAQWFASDAMDDRLAYQLLEALWSPRARARLDADHAKGREITLDTALEGAAVPLHAGAERFYRQRGVLG